METGEIINKLKSAVPSCVLEKSRFGRSGNLSLWVDSRTILLAAGFLKDDPEVRLEWLENMSAIQMDGALVVTYFLRSYVSKASLMIRASLEPAGPSKDVSLASVSSIWAMASAFEFEIQELFGIRFEGLAQGGVIGQRLPKNWNGFPLRKTYVFPTEFLGIPHARKNAPREGNA